MSGTNRCKYQLIMGLSSPIFARLPTHNKNRDTMSNSSDLNFFSKLPSRSKAIILAAVFALFAPLSLIVSAPVGLGRTWIGIAGWLVLSGIIAITWAYCYFEQKHLWLPPTVTVLLSFGFPALDYWTDGTPIESTLPVSIAAVVLIVVGYVGFVVFIKIEGTRAVRLQAEMDVARRIHSYLVPEIKFDNGLYDIAGISIASAEMGGDVTDVTEVDERVCVTIADVSGHGVPAGILMSALKGSLLTSLSDDGCTGDNGGFLNTVNATLHRISSPDMYCTLTTLILGQDRSCRIYNAGHPDTLHYRAGTGSVDLISSTGIPVGVMVGMPYEGKDVELHPGDILVLFTDGLTETENRAGKMLGVEPLAEQLTELATRPAPDIAQRLLAFASEFGDTDDDRSVLIVKVQ
ncbi:SpoIIE family protein phosphatase [candidate division GN15 bacterium]|nr:SpoIIE family protein phosphatase [candidate division GN15 bacterium]